jgi:hypothetical protein
MTWKKSNGFYNRGKIGLFNENNTNKFGLFVKKIRLPAKNVILLNIIVEKS